MTSPPACGDAYDAALLPPLRSHIEDLALALFIWTRHDDTEPDAHARRCANTAMDAIDAALAELYAIRAQLTGEIRASDDATAARVDAMLAERAAR
jgi:hypothetical protein